MKKRNKIGLFFVSLVIMAGWSNLVWNISDDVKDENSLGMTPDRFLKESRIQLNSDPMLVLRQYNKPQKYVQNWNDGASKHRALVHAVYTPDDKEYTLFVIEGCEYMKNLGGSPPTANTDYVHKGNCINPIHPENLKIDWDNLNRVLAKIDIYLRD